jgi:hypothetical protein
MRVPTLSLCLSVLVAVGCAGTRAHSRLDAPAPLARGETRWETCFPVRSYGEDDTARMQQMLEDGAAPKQIAAKLGGSPQEVRCWLARTNRWWHDGSTQVARLARNR